MTSPSCGEAMFESRLCGEGSVSLDCVRVHVYVCVCHPHAVERDLRIDCVVLGRIDWILCVRMRAYDTMES